MNIKPPTLRSVRSYNKPSIRMEQKLKVPKLPSLDRMIKAGINNKIKNINRPYRREKY